MRPNRSVPIWTWASPLLGFALVALASLAGFGKTFPLSWGEAAIAVAFGPIVFGAVYSAVHHAEAVAGYTGEPYGTLVLTVAVTIIELALIVSVMMSGGGSPELARDTVYSVVMIVCNGLVGLCLLSGGIRFREQNFEPMATSIYIAVLIVLTTITLLLPNYVSAVPGPVYSQGQLIFISVATIALYLVFLYTQTIRHVDYFTGGGETSAGRQPQPVSYQTILLSAGLLVLSIAAVVLLAKKFAPVMDHGVAALGFPRSVTALIIAILILLPEGAAAVRAARRDELQTSLNLALGSSLATIGLTIPAVAALNLFLQTQLILGLEPKEAVLLVMTFAASILTLGTGKTNILFGFLHLVIFATFLFLTFVP